MKNWIDTNCPTHDHALGRVAAATDRVFKLLDRYHGAARFNGSIGVQASADDATQAAQRDRAKEVWANEIAKLMPSMLNAGIVKTRGTDYPPSLGQFIEACKPTAEAAFFEAQGGMSARGRGFFGDWSCPAVYWAAAWFGSAELKTAQWNFQGKRWVKFFDDAMKKQEAGELLPIPDAVPENQRIEHTPRTERSEEVEAKVQGFVSAAKSNAGALSWAHRCKSIGAAKMLASGLNGAHRQTLALAGNFHLKSGKLERSNDGVWAVGKFWVAA